MANKALQRGLGATDGMPRAGNFKLGSAESRAAARAMLEARNAGELRFQVVSVVDGSRVKLDALAEVIHAGRMRAAAAISGVEFVQEDKRERRPDCLAERIREGRERVRRARDQAPATSL